MTRNQEEELRQAKIIDHLTANWEKHNSELADDLGISERGIRRWREKIRNSTLYKSVQKELSGGKEKRELRDTKAKLNQALQQVSHLSQIVQARDNLSKANPDKRILNITPSSKKDNESIMTAVWSDWHVEESVDYESVNGVNEYNLDIAKKRVERCIESTVELYNSFSAGTNITTLVLALLGDFITNDIHDELVELNALKPIEACLWVRSVLTYGINYVLQHTPDDLKIIVQCHSGNHSRTTQKTRFSTEAGHSLEYFMYKVIADDFKGNPRIHFNVPTGYHSYLSYFGNLVRFHHGHAVKYGGGVGGLTIPVNKAIHQWNSIKHAELDVFGHFHQPMDGDKFIINGSLIGYSPHALAIKAEAKSPRQVAFLWHKQHKKTIVAPIIVE